MTKKTPLVDVSACLQKAISKALKSYHTFMLQEAPDDAKGFTAHHNAAKVAIAHVELLLKTAKTTAADKTAEDTEAEFQKLLDEAEAELKKYKSRQDIWEEEGDNGDDL